MEPRILDNQAKRDTDSLAKATGVYKGSVSAAGALTNGASGFSCAAPSSSVFTVTHNLGLTANSYTVVATVTGASAGACAITTRATNAFTVTTSDLATPSAADRAFDFVMIVGDGE